MRIVLRLVQARVGREVREIPVLLLVSLLVELLQECLEREVPEQVVLGQFGTTFRALVLPVHAL